MTKDSKKTGLDLLREPFPDHQISKLPKPTKKQTEEVRNNYNAGTRCAVCNGWHHPKVLHLDYVGHAAITDRLLDCDPEWNWDPVSVNEFGAPVLDGFGGMWIKLTVCGVTRLGYGHPDGKKGGDAIKEAIGDAIRNAAMRFGAALDLWHKGDLHGGSDGEFEADSNQSSTITPDQAKELDQLAIRAASNLTAVFEHFGISKWEELPADEFNRVRKGLAEKIAKLDAENSNGGGNE